MGPAKEGIGEAHAGRRPETGANLRARASRAALLIVFVLALAGCRTAGYCLRQVPEPMRADVLRYSLDMRLSDPNDMPESERKLADERGRPRSVLTPTEIEQIRPWAVRYSHCMNNE